jgi:hypothetical protein
MNGAIQQLERQGAMNNQLFPNDMARVAEEYVQHDCHLQFNSNKEFRFIRNADTISKILFNIKLAPAPRGYCWKENWYNHFFKRISLQIANSTIFSKISEMLQMDQLIHGTRGAKELCFDYTKQERMRLSREPHEVIVEPLKLSELIHSGIIRMVALQFNDFKVVIETARLEDCLEQEGTLVRPPLPENQNAFILQSSSSVLFQFLDNDARRAMAQTPYTDVIKQHSYTYETVNTNQQSNLRLNENNVCSAAYLWITDENNNEIPRQLVSNIRVQINNHDRLNLSGLHCRHINKNSMPHTTVDNSISQNLYYISYYPRGGTQPNGAEQGLNLLGIDNYDWKIQWNQLPQNQNVKLHIVHRTNNILWTGGGIARLQFMDGIQIRDGAPRPAFQPIVYQLIDQPPLEFLNTDQLIDIQYDELCMLTHNTFTEGVEIDYCLGCKKGFTTELLNMWFTASDGKKCIHCARPYNTTTFKRGKVHLIGMIGDNENEGQPLNPFM